MYMSYTKDDFMTSETKKMLMYFNMSSNLSFFWNGGSMLGFIFMIQFFSGIMLSFWFMATSPLCFFTLNYFIENTVNLGFLFRLIHLNFSTAFFIMIYFHIMRGMYYKSFKKTKVWWSGMTIILLLMLTAFVGYTLPFGQMSYWAAIVITNFLTVIPILGKKIAEWVWGDFMFTQNSLNVFSSLHYFFPMLMMILIFTHMVYLHQNFSTNKNMFTKMKLKKPFMNFLLWQDIMNIIMIWTFFILFLSKPWLFDDEENSKMADLLSSPIHIKPEWYFLFIYAILRSIPNKLGGVIFLLLSVLVYFPMSFKKTKKKSMMKTLYFWMFLNTLILLTWVGGKSVEYPYENIGVLMLITYFLLLIIF